MRKTENACLPVVVLGGGVTGLGVVRAFSRQRIPVFVLPAASDELRFSRWYRPLPSGPSSSPDPARSVKALRSALDASGIERAFLCPCSDDWNRVVAEFSEGACGQYISVAPSRSSLVALQDKASLAMLLQQLGVPMPDTRMIHGPADIDQFPDAKETFYFLKPTDSQSFLAKFGVKGFRVPNATEARMRLDEVVRAGLGVVLQEYVPGPPDEHRFIDGYVDRAGRVKALFARRRLRIYPPDFGNSTFMVSVSLDEVAPAVESVRRVLGEVAYRGIFSAEFKRDPRDGAFKLLEINTRPWWFVDFAVRCGVDVCRMAYDDAQEMPVREVSAYEVGARCIYPYYDFFSVQPLVRSGVMGWRRWLGDVVRARQPVACWDDPLPGIVGLLRVMFAAIRHRLLRWHL